MSLMTATEGDTAKTVLVTGGGRGSRAGALRILVFTRCKSVSAFTRAPLNANAESDHSFSSVTKVHVDVRSEESVRDMFRWADSIGLTFDAVINCAGVGAFGPMHELTLEA